MRPLTRSLIACLLVAAFAAGCAGSASPSVAAPISGVPAPATSTQVHVAPVPSLAALGSAPSIEAVLTSDGSTLLVVVRNLPTGTAAFVQSRCPADPTVSLDALLDNTYLTLLAGNGVLTTSESLPADAPTATTCALSLLAAANGQTTVIAATSYVLPAGTIPTN